uniref:Uncharacterized protein n=1 Tax=Sciurus vulgaris TaxID=55149 RepID=A0A8D2DM60_SCIVU
MGSRASTLLRDEELEEIKKETAGKISRGFQNLPSTHWGTGSLMPSFQREKTR